jgi:hypothetical protein
MPKYFFDIRSSDGTVVPDKDGETLPDAAAALTEAQQCAQKLALAEFQRTGTVDGRKVEIVSEAGKLLDDVPVRDAITGLPGKPAKPELP